MLIREVLLPDMTMISDPFCPLEVPPILYRTKPRGSNAGLMHPAAVIAHRVLSDGIYKFHQDHRVEVTVYLIDDIIS